MVMIKDTGEKDSGLDVGILLTTLIAYRRGDFSARMPNDWIGVHGKIADTLNEIVDMAERTTNDFGRVSQVVGKAGKVNARLSVADLHGSWARLVDSSNTLIEDLVSPLNEMVRVINAVSTGDLSQSVLLLHSNGSSAIRPACASWSSTPQAAKTAAGHAVAG